MKDQERKQKRAAKAQYVDGFVLPLRKENVEAYRRLAEEVAEMWTDLGALEYCECIGEDLDVEPMIPFPKLAAATKEETVVFAYVVWPSREARDKGNKAFMADPRNQEIAKKCEAILECHRMAYGGFSQLVHYRKEN